jgi:uncharacterized protein (DUF1810 family)
MAMDPDEAELFTEAQDVVWADVVSELTAGRKSTHWMWFVFPQLAALGRSNTSQLYGLHDLDEARAYLAHATLRARLVEAAGLLLAHRGTDPVEILGGIDARKLRSSMTLFAAVPDAPPVFSEVLEAFYGGERCGETLRLISEGDA